MDNLKNKIKSIVAVTLVGASVSSCSLDMLPLNDVVLENYWTNKSDVESVVLSCYAGMQENGYLSKTIAWGEVRADNVDLGPRETQDGQLGRLMSGKLQTTNSYCDWSAIYNVINRCNTVLYYAPIVADEDPNYTQSDLNITIAECKAIRAMSYLTLIKTFQNVPFSLEPSIDDNVDYRLPATAFEVILDSLIADIESCKDYAPRRYSVSVYNTAKITRAAMYSVLAELYLWRASDHQLTVSQQNEYYRKCIEACDWVINFKCDQYNANDFLNREGNNVNLTDNIDKNVLSEYGYPLLSEIRGTGTAPYAFNSIFSTGNSFESIFELTYSYPVQSVNTDVSDMYGGYSNGTLVQHLAAKTDILSNAPTSSSMTYGDGSLFTTCTDCRSVFPFHWSDGGDRYDINKYVVNGVMLMRQSGGSLQEIPLSETTLFTEFTSYASSNVRQNDSRYENWIFYRLTEIMLFRAEAEIELAGNLSKISVPDDEMDENEVDNFAKKRAVRNGASLTSAEDLYDDAFNIISAVYLRSNPATLNRPAARPSRANYTTLESFETLLMNERNREFLFEGKRYYDLVRQARRDGNTDRFKQALQSKFSGNAALNIKLSMMDFMYMPILKSQIQVNPNLTQNPAYADEDDVVIN